MQLMENISHIWRRLVGGSGAQKPAAEPKPQDTVEGANPAPETRRQPAEAAPSEAPENGPLDNLTAIRGIGAATQMRLNAAGIKSYRQLADADPEYLRRALNERRQNAKVERWISRARELAPNDWRPI